MKSNTNSRLLWRSLTVGVVLLVVCSTPGVAAAASFSDTQTQSDTITTSTAENLALATTENNTTYYDDFEDGDLEGWQAENPDVVANVQAGVFGDRALRINDSGTSHANLFWEGGPDIDMGENFEITGTMNATDASNAGRVRMGISDNETQSGSQALIVFSEEYDKTYLATSWDETPSEAGGGSINSSMHDQWNRFRMQIDSGVVRAKVWKVGTEEPSEWQMEREFTEFEGKFFANAGINDVGRDLRIGQIDMGGNKISGRVVDQHGSPVSNATIEAIGVDYESLNDSIENKEDRAQELLEQAENPLPDAWKPNVELTGSNGKFQNLDSRYVAVHTTDSWQLGGGQLPGTEYRVNVDPELENPKLVAPNDDQLILTLWDPTNTGGVVFNREDSADSDLPGRTTNGTIVIEQISPTGDVVDRMERDTQKYVTLNPSFSLDTKTHQAVAVDLPNNQFYRIYPKGNEEAAYVISRGNPQEIGYALTQDLRTEAGQLTDRAEQLRSQIEDGTFRRVTTTTNESGYFEIRALRGVQTASIQAYRADGEVLTDITGPSIDDLRTAHERGYNGSVYISPAPKTVEAPSQNNTIEVYKSPTPPFGDMATYQDILDRLQNEFLNQSTAALESMFNDRLENVSLDELEARHEELRALIQSNEELRSRMNELLEDDLSDGDVSRSELTEEVSAMERSIADLEEQMDTGTPETNLDGSELHASFPFGGDLNSDAVSVIVHYQNGTSQVISEDYWRVQSASMLGGDEVVVDGYPLPADAAVADIEVTGVSESGALGSSRASVTNPAFDQEVPEINAIDVSTLRPGTDETVSVNLRTDDPSFGGVEDVTVYGPDGNTVQTTIEDDTARFSPASAGIQSVRVTYSNQGGTNFVQSFQIEANDQATSNPPTVRIIEGVGGLTAIAGDKLDSAQISKQNGVAQVVAQAPAGESPSILDVRAESLSVDQVNVRVVSGSQREAVNNHVTLRLHTSFSDEETLIYRSSPAEPITSEASTKYGAWETRENDDGDSHQVIETYTGASGEVTVQTSRNPGIMERILYELAVSSPVDLPFAMISSGILPADLPMPELPTMITYTDTAVDSIAEPATTISVPATPQTAGSGLGVTA